MRRTIVLAALVLTTSAAQAHAALPAGNQLFNGDAEAGSAPTGDCNDTVQRPSWTSATGTLGSCRYGGASGVPTDADAPSPHGTYFFLSPNSQPTSVSTQVVDLTGAAPEIDGGTAQANLQGDIGGFGGQNDEARLKVVFLNGSGTELSSSFELPRVLAADRGGQTKLIRRTASGQIPAGTRRARVELTLTGAGSNDGYADNLVLTLSAFTPPPPPPPAPTPTPSPAPAPAPTPAPTPAPANPNTPTGPVPPAAGQGGVFTGLPSTRKCLSRRNFRIRVRRVRGYRTISWSVFVNKRRVATRTGKRVTAPVDLRGLPKGRYSVRIVGVLQTGDVVSSTRRYRTCVPRRFR